MAIHHVSWNAHFPESSYGGAVTIGNFDGVHRGHQALLTELKRQAGIIGGTAVAITFDPPPSHLLRPSAVPTALTTLAERTRLMLAHGADEVLVVRTTMELLQRSASEFFHEVIRRGLRAKAVVPGFNFAFGHDREGNVEMLARLCQEAHIPCIPVPPLEVDGQPVSSSRIRGELRAGKVSGTRVLIGRPYRIEGRVAYGERRGQKLGFPTANLECVTTLVPADGVYAVRAFHAGRAWAGAANIGPNPTFGEQTRKIEVHLLDFSGDLYGEVLVVDFLCRLRETRKFDGVQALVEQMTADIAAARQVVENEEKLTAERAEQ